MKTCNKEQSHPGILSQKTSHIIHVMEWFPTPLLMKSRPIECSEAESCSVFPNQTVELGFRGVTHSSFLVLISTLSKCLRAWIIHLHAAGRATLRTKDFLFNCPIFRNLCQVLISFPGRRPSYEALVGVIILKIYIFLLITVKRISYVVIKNFHLSLPPFIFL